MADASTIAAKIKDGSLTSEDMAAVPPENFQDPKFIETVTIAATLVLGQDEPDQLKPLFDSRQYRAGLAKHADVPTALGLSIIDRLEVPLKTALRDAGERKKAALKDACGGLFSASDIQTKFSPNMLHVLKQAYPSFQTTTGIGPENPGG